MLKITAFQDYREYSPATRRKILYSIREKSFDAVRIPFSHAAMEPALRRYDVAECEEMFQEASEAGLKVVPSFCFRNPPWLSGAAPEDILRCRCLFLEHAVRHFRSKRDLAFFYLPPELECSPPDSAFRIWLMKRYSSMQILNRTLAVNFNAPEDISCEYAASASIRMRTMLNLFYNEFAEEQRNRYRNSITASAETAKAITRTIRLKPSFTGNRLLAELSLSSDDFLLNAADWTSNPPSVDLPELLLAACTGRTAGVEWADAHPLPKPCGITVFPAGNPPSDEADRPLIAACIPKDAEQNGDAVQTAILRSPLSDALYRAFACGSLHKKSFRLWNRALSDASVPHSVLPEDAEIPAGLSLIVVPAAVALNEETTERLLMFAHRGGLLFCEGDCGHYGSCGNFLEPARRFLAEATGIVEQERIRLPSDRLKCSLDGKTFFLNTEEEASPLIPVKRWTETVSAAPNGNALFLSVCYGKGRILLCAPRLSKQVEKTRGLDPLVQSLLSAAGLSLPFRVLRTPGNEIPVMRFQKCGSRKRMYLFLPKNGAKCEIEFQKGFWSRRILTELSGSGKISLEPSSGGFMSLKWKPSPRRSFVLSE